MSYGPPAFPPPPSEPAPQLTGRSLHPLSLTRIVELSIRLLRFQWRPIYGVAAVILVPLYVISGALQSIIAEPFYAWLADVQRMLEQLTPGAVPPDLPPLPAGFYEAIVASIVLGIAAGAVVYVANAAIVHAIGEAYEGRNPSIRGSLGAVARRLLTLLAVMIITGLVIAGLMVLGFSAGVLAIALGDGGGLGAFAGLLVIVATVFAAVFIGIRWSLVPQTVMLEDNGPLASLGRSWSVVGGSTLRVLGYLIVIGLVIGLIVSSLTTVANQLLTAGRLAFDPAMIAAQSVVGGLIGLIFVPFTNAVFSLLYYDLRWRRGELTPPVEQPAHEPPLPYGG